MNLALLYHKIMTRTVMIESYGLHGVTWHGNFGHPMSHGCINLPTESETPL